MNYTTARFARTLRSIDGTSCLGIDGPIIPTRPGWIERLVRWVRGWKVVEAVIIYRLYREHNGVRHALEAVRDIVVRGLPF